MLERINLILKTRNLNAAQFADEIGVQRSSVSHILTGRNNASLDFLLKVLTRYPEIDTDWLLTGKGVMMRSVATADAINKTELKRSEPANITFYQTSRGTTGDLFQHAIDVQDEKEELVKNKEDISSEVIKQKEALVREEAQKKPEEMVLKNTSSRQIEKIVIFYSDKSFGEYNPEG